MAVRMESAITLDGDLLIAGDYAPSSEGERRANQRERNRLRGLAWRARFYPGELSRPMSALDHECEVRRL